jgi:flagellar basal-body rod modification protein FlgD
MTLLSANPQSGLVRFGVELPAATHVAAEVVDATGRRVRELGGSVLPAGGHVLSWDGRNAAGAPLPSGVYFVRMQAGVQSSTLKLVRLP